MFDLRRDTRLREKEREFGQRKEEATIRGGGCDENYPCRFGLVLERGHHSVGFSFISIFFFNKLCLVARKGRKVNNGVTILLIDLLGLNLILFSLFLVFSLGIEIKSYIACIFVNCLKMLDTKIVIVELKMLSLALKIYQRDTKTVY